VKKPSFIHKFSESHLNQDSSSLSFQMTQLRNRNNNDGHRITRNQLSVEIRVMKTQWQNKWWKLECHIGLVRYLGGQYLVNQTHLSLFA